MGPNFECGWKWKSGLQLLEVWAFPVFPIFPQYFFYFIIYLFWQSLSTAARGLILVKVELELEKLSPVEMSGWAF